MRDPAFSKELKEKIAVNLLPVPPLPKNIVLKKIRDDMPRGLKLSAGLHISVVVFALVFAGLNRLLGWDSERQARIKLQEMARTAIRVDVVDLPRLKISDLSKIDVSQEVNPQAAKREETPETKPQVDSTAMIDKTQPTPKPAKTAKNTAKDRLKQLKESLKAEQRRKELAEELAKKVTKNSDNSGGGGRPELAGNILSQGYSVTGDLATEQDVFRGKIQAHIYKNWSVPAWMKASALRAVVLVKVAPDGRILEKEFLKKSGDEIFDSAVERAMELSDPLPPPPDSLKRIFLEEGIECSFPR